MSISHCRHQRGRVHLSDHAEATSVPKSDQLERRSRTYEVPTDRHWTSLFSVWSRAQGKGSDARTQPRNDQNKFSANGHSSARDRRAAGKRPDSPCQNPVIQACNGQVMRLVNWGRSCERRILLRAEYAGLLRRAEPVSLDGFRGFSISALEQEAC
ncbi:hypothetical protein BJX96DRAFT_21501 [Aspergillus floccosus]